MKRILEVVLALLDTDCQELFSRRRDQRSMLARQALAGALFGCTIASGPEVARTLGRTHHSSLFVWRDKFNQWPPPIKSIWLDKVRDVAESGDLESVREWYRSESG